MDLRFLEGIGGGLTALSQQLTALEMRKLAEEERAADRKRQQEQDALQRAQMSAQSDRSLRSENFRQAGATGTKSANVAILNNIALQQGKDEYTDPLTQKVWMRGEGEAPNEQKAAFQAALQDQKDQTRLLLQQQADKARMERQVTTSGDAELREGGVNARYDRVGANVRAAQDGATQRTGMQQAGALQRAGMQQAGADRRLGGGAGLGKKTEGQAQAEVFSGLMASAEGELSKNPWGTKPLGAPTEIALKGDGKGFVGNAVAALARSRMAPEQQRAVQSRLQFTQAALYAFSGKSAPDAEVAKNVAIFFPQSGETDPTLLAQKARMRATATMLLERRKGGSVTGELPLAPDAATGGASSALSRLNSLGRP